MIMNKREIRKIIRERTSKYSRDELAEFSRNISGALENICPENSDAVFLYAALPDEPDLTGFAKRCRAGGIKTCYPKVHGDTMSFFEVSDESELSSGAFGINEPGYSNAVTPAAFNKPIIIVPGRAFDKNGNRLGRGKGYYDKYLAENSFDLVVGCCFPFQMIDNLENVCEPHDKKMNIVVNG